MIGALIVAASAWLLPSAPEDFDFYLGELVTHELSADDKMSILINERLAESIFETSDEAIFKQRLTALHAALEKNPSKLDRFNDLDRRLSAVFAERVRQGKRVRLLYAAGGAVLGALVAIPIARLASTSRTALFIAIPAGVLGGAGAGYLLGQMIGMPHYDLEGSLFNKDLEFMNTELEGENP